MKSYNVRMITYLFVFILSLSLLSCATTKYNETFTSKSYKTLATSATFYDTTMKSLADLHRLGKLSDANRDKAINLGKSYHDSYHAAVAALELYETTKLPVDEQAAMTSVEKFESDYNLFLQFVTPFIDAQLQPSG